MPIPSHARFTPALIPIRTDSGAWATTWPLKLSFPLFLRNMLYVLGNVSDSSADGNVVPGQPKVLRPGGDVLIQAFLVRKDGPEKLGAALEKRSLSEDTAKRLLRTMFLAGHSEPTLINVISRYAGLEVAPKPLTPAEVGALWAALKDPDAGKAWRAVWRLAEDSDQALLRLKGELKPAERAWQTANNTYGFSDGLGTMEITIGLLTLLGVFSRRWGIVGATLSFLTPFVTLSADVTVESVRACEEAGVAGFLAKPVVAAQLLELLAEISEQATVPGAARPSSVRGY